MMPAMSDVATIVIPLTAAEIARVTAIGGAIYGGRKEKAQWLRTQPMNA
jgi:hypothetical protein